MENVRVKVNATALVISKYHFIAKTLLNDVQKIDTAGVSKKKKFVLVFEPNSRCFRRKNVKKWTLKFKFHGF